MVAEVTPGVQKAPPLLPTQNWQPQPETMQKWYIRFDGQVENGKYGTFQGTYYPKQIALKANDEGYQGSMEINMNMQHMQMFYIVPPLVQPNRLQALMINSLTALLHHIPVLHPLYKDQVCRCLH